MSRLIVLPEPGPEESPEITAIRQLFKEAFGDADRAEINDPS